MAAIVTIPGAVYCSKPTRPESVPIPGIKAGPWPIERVSSQFIAGLAHQPAAASENRSCPRSAYLAGRAHRTQQSVPEIA